MQPLHVLLQCLPRQDRPRRADLLLEAGTRFPRLANPVKKGIVKVLNTALRSPGMFHFCIKAGRLGEKIAPHGLLYCSANAWGRDRELPEFTSRTFEQIWKEELSSSAPAGQGKSEESGK